MRQADLLAKIENLRQQQESVAQRLHERVERERRKYEAALDRWRAS
jgi:hypothetical protein